MVYLIFFSMFGVKQAKGWRHHGCNVFAHMNSSQENRGMGVERVSSACDTVAPAITFPIGYFLIQGKECAVVERAWVFYYSD